MNRREMIGKTAATAALSATAFPFQESRAAETAARGLKGNIRHSVSQWCYGNIPLEDLAKACKEMGIESIELLNEKDWATVKAHGLKCAVGYATDWGIPKGFNRLENHDKLVADFEAMIPKAAAAGVPNLICFSGNREGQNDQVGMIKCAIVLLRMMPISE